MAKFTRAEIRNILGDACTEEIENRLVALHLGVVDPLKDDLTKYKADAEKLPGVQKELDDLKAAGDGGYKEKYEKEHSAFEAFKTDITAKESKAAKERAVRAYFESKNITGANLDLAMRGCGEEMSAFDYLEGALDIEYIVNSKGEYLGARVLVAFGGPNIWVNTRTGIVEGAWWADRADASFTDNIGLNDALSELWACR